MTSSDHRIDAGTGRCWRVLSVLWGGSFFFIGVVIRELPPLTVVLLRVALAALILLPVLWVVSNSFAEGACGLEAVLRHRAAQQRPAILADRHRTDLYLERAGLDSERDHAAVHRAGDGRRRRRKTAGAPRRRCRHRADRRRHPARPASWLRQRPGSWHPALPCRRLQLRTVGALCATTTVELAAAGDRDVPDAGVDADDDGHRRRGRASLATADAGRDDMAGAGSVLPRCRPRWPISCSFRSCGGRARPMSCW